MQNGNDFNNHCLAWLFLHNLIYMKNWCYHLNKKYRALIFFLFIGNPFSQFVGHPFKFSSPRVIPHPPIQWVINRQAPFECTSEGWFPDPTDCTLFYRCVRLALLNEDFYLVYPFICPPGTYFDGVTDICYHVDNFTGCGIILAKIVNLI